MCDVTETSHFWESNKLHIPVLANKTRTHLIEPNSIELNAPEQFASG